MPIPDFDEHGLLPEGLHDCTLQEVRQRFARFQRSDRRPRLFARLEQFMAEVKASGIIAFVILDGSFVTADAEPNDIDIVLGVPVSHDFGSELAPAGYNVVAGTRVRRMYGFDTVVVRENSPGLSRAVEFFQQVKRFPLLRKGLLRINL
jgi:hypothetical protein